MAEHSLYRALILEHRRRPRNFGSLPDHTHAADGVNALCGDRLRIEAQCRDGRVAVVRFSGEACAIATASASLLSGFCAGFDAADLAALQRRFGALLESGADDPALGDFCAFAGLAAHPLRHRCALLPWATLRAALAGRAGATTESGDD